MIESEMTCPGLPADWINGWLAAVGTTVLDSRIRLHWTSGGTPVAVLSASAADCNPVKCLTESWPDRSLLSRLPLAEKWNGDGELRRKVDVDVFARRVRLARGDPYSWTLSSTMTDLCVLDDGDVAHAPFDPSGPGPTKWLHHRLERVHKLVEPTQTRILKSLTGGATRVKNNGLGFDLTRFGSMTDATATWIDPVIEVLAFFGLRLLPMRGSGTDRRSDGRGDTNGRQRGWHSTSGTRGPLRFNWPAWDHPLSWSGIDALMDVWKPARRSTWGRLGVHAGWQSIRRKTASADTTRAYGSERL